MRETWDALVNLAVAVFVVGSFIHEHANEQAHQHELERERVLRVVGLFDKLDRSKPNVEDNPNFS